MEEMHDSQMAISNNQNIDNFVFESIVNMCWEFVGLFINICQK